MKNDDPQPEPSGLKNQPQSPPGPYRCLSDQSIVQNILTPFSDDRQTPFSVDHDATKVEIEQLNTDIANLNEFVVKHRQIMGDPAARVSTYDLFSWTFNRLNAIHPHFASRLNDVFSDFDKTIPQLCTQQARADPDGSAANHCPDVQAPPCQMPPVLEADQSQPSQSASGTQDVPMDEGSDKHELPPPFGLVSREYVAKEFYVRKMLQEMYKVTTAQLIVQRERVPYLGPAPEGPKSRKIDCNDHFTDANNENTVGSLKTPEFQMKHDGDAADNSSIDNDKSDIHVRNDPQSNLSGLQVDDNNNENKENNENEDNNENENKQNNENEENNENEDNNGNENKPPEIELEPNVETPASHPSYRKYVSKEFFEQIRNPVRRRKRPLIYPSNDRPLDLDVIRRLELLILMLNIQMFLLKQLILKGDDRSLW